MTRIMKKIVRIFSAIALTVMCNAAVAIYSSEKIVELRAEAEQGNAKAQDSLGSAYSNGWGVAEDKREAVRWWRKAAEQGHAEAQWALGVAYATGEGIADDEREAVRWYRKAAEQGLAMAQYLLSLAYDNGEGVAMDAREAARWRQMAVEQDNPHVQLFIRLEQGDANVLFLFGGAHGQRRAAEQGHVQAQYFVGSRYWELYTLICKPYLVCSSFHFFSNSSLVGCLSFPWGRGLLKRTSFIAFSKVFWSIFSAIFLLPG